MRYGVAGRHAAAIVLLWIAALLLIGASPQSSPSPAPSASPLAGAQPR
jgi:hypothetical protein